jgi:hypothetical protein
LLEIGIVVKNPAKVMGVGTTIVFDKARRFDDPHDIRIELAAIEVVPGYVIERPGAHDAPPLCYVCCLSR